MLVYSFPPPIEMLNHIILCQFQKCNVVFFPPPLTTCDLGSLGLSREDQPNYRGGNMIHNHQNFTMVADDDIYCEMWTNKIQLLCSSSYRLFFCETFADL